MNTSRIIHLPCTLARLGAIALLTLLGAFAVPNDARADESSRPQLSRPELEKLFESGNALFRAGVELYKSDRAASESKFREAAGAWREVARSGKISNADLENDIANASVFAGDIPNAILAYRRALSIDPANKKAEQGLAAARRSAGTEALLLGAPASKEENVGALRGALDAIGAFARAGADRASEFVSLRALLVVGSVCYVLFFIGASVRVLGLRKVHGSVLGILLLCAVLTTLPIVMREVHNSRREEAVVLAANVTARNGPADMYDPAFKEPLRPGLEVRVEERRGEWSKIRLRDGRAAWIRSDSLELV
ncbi:MAG: hypothetical protein KF691_10140 [Phycisphaeraceae bacterium]|nr:hypothetical protein [Phycisphaeraceae bacterium]